MKIQHLKVLLRKKVKKFIYWIILETRSASLSRFLDSEELDRHYVNLIFIYIQSKKIFFLKLLLKNQEDIRLPPKKINMQNNGDNSNNNNGIMARLATVKSAKRDQKAQPNVRI